MSCSSKIQNCLPFWCWHTEVVLEKRPLNECSVDCGVVVVVNTNTSQHAKTTKTMHFLQHVKQTVVECVRKHLAAVEHLHGL